MKKKHTRIIASIIAGLLALLMILPFIVDIVVNTGSAANTVTSLNSKLDSIEKEKAKLQAEINKLNKEKKDNQKKKNALDSEISVMRKEINVINDLITEYDNQIDTFTGELKEIQSKETEQYEAYKMRVRVMEEEGSISYISVLLNANSFSDLLTKAEIIRSVMTYDQGIMDQLEDTRKQVEEKKRQIEASMAEQAAAKAKLVDRQATLKTKSAAVGEVIDDLNDSVAEYKKKFNAAESAMQATKNELKKLLNKSTQTKYVGGDFMWPTPSCTIITSAYGIRLDPITKVRSKHTGIDIGAKKGSNIVASNSGTVVTSGWSSRGYGNYVVIDHGGGMSTLYAHMSKRLVTKGQKVTKGDVIGLVGSTGYSTGPHLHFEILKNGDDTNPMNYFTKK